MILRNFLLVAVLAITSCGLVLDATSKTEFDVQGEQLLMAGIITSRTPARFEEIIAANPQITTIVETSVDGSVDDEAMIAMAYRVRELGLNTHLKADSEIYSGGVDLFLAGVNRTMQRGAVIGVHSWADGFRDGIEYPRDSPEHALNRDYIEDMLGDDAFYWFTLQAAPANGIHLMTDAEIRRFGLLTRPQITP
ncbi:MAG: alpha/beta hydrolase [Sulfitobacter sp.]